MALSDLDANDKKVYEYLKLYDFVENPWSTKKAAKALASSIAASLPIPSVAPVIKQVRPLMF